VFVYADGDADLLTLGGERYVDELHRRHREFLDYFTVASTEVMIMAFRLFYAPPPTVRSIRRPLDEVLRRR
jgi:hypothetical protein